MVKSQVISDLGRAHRQSSQTVHRREARPRQSRTWAAVIGTAWCLGKLVTRGYLRWLGRAIVGLYKPKRRHLLARCRRQICS